MTARMGRDLCRLILLAFILVTGGEIAPASAPPEGIAKFVLTPGPLQISERAGSERFINAVGEKSGIWGYEDGTLEGWVYPLKIFHDFQLSFQLEGSPRTYSGRELLASVRVFPQMVQLQYSAEMFTVNEILFAPRSKPGIAVLLNVNAPCALRIYARFKPDLNLMWPGGLGGQTYTWDKNNKWIKLAEPTDQLSALIGSPFANGSNAVGYHVYLTDQHPFEELELNVTPEQAKQYYIPIVATAGIKGTYDAQKTYSEILKGFPTLYEESLRHYEELDSQGPQFITPDAAVNDSLRWSRVALDQLKVCNPYLGCSYVSGYGSSGKARGQCTHGTSMSQPSHRGLSSTAAARKALRSPFVFLKSISAATAQSRMRSRKVPRSSTGLRSIPIPIFIRIPASGT